IIEPDNKHYKPVIDSCYNLYKPFPHKSAEGSFKWSKIIIEHIFGDQYEIGLKYIQSLYLSPKRALPVLVLVSKQRSTGKTTFLNWLNMIFGENMVVVDPHDITNSFNSIYATSNIIAIEETVIEKRQAIEKIKSLSTGKFVSVNQKYVANYKIPFYGHIIMTSNEKDNFINIDDEEIRFFIRELSKPKFENFNIEDDLVKEIPAFLNYLDSLPALDYTKSRALFTPDELGNKNLETVKEESKTWLFEELRVLIDDFFDNNSHISSFYATVGDIKTKWLANNTQVSLRYIRKVLVNEFKFEKIENSLRYEPFTQVSEMTKNKVGKAYLFEKELPV
ncbi:MAG: hypothetical protein GY853_16850, partial [PVC group bacterium]|nr:hypothetical protein [PVC group bacterium]